MSAAAVRPRRVDATADDGPDDDPGDALLADERADTLGEQVPVQHEAARLAHWTLNAAIVRPHLNAGPVPGWVTGLTPPVGEGPADVVDLAHQAQVLIEARTDDLLRAVTGESPPVWVAGLPARPDGDLDPDAAAAWEQAALAVAAYRDTFAVDTDSLLGPEPETSFQARARDLAAAQLDALSGTRGATREPALWAASIDPYADPDFDWSALDPGEVTAPTRAEARTMHTWTPLGDAEDPGQHPDPMIDLGDGEGPVLWEPSYTMQVAAEPDWTRPPAPSQVASERLDRLAQVNRSAYAFWVEHAASGGSWVPGYLAGRGLQHVPPAHAPAGWTSTLDHLRKVGFTAAELIDAGLAVRSRRGGLVDRFRDRLALPLHDADGRLSGFTARANPADTSHDTPKYLNTPATDLFDKSATLAGLTPDARAALATGATPVLVEGALDAAAVTAAGAGRLIGLAPCGTALTPAQLRELAGARGGALDGLVLGFDDDTAGRAATVRAWDLLGPRAAAGVRQAIWKAKDPADLAAGPGPAAVVDAVEHARPVVEQLVDHHLADVDLHTVEGRVYTARAVAAAVVPGLSLDLASTAGARLVAAYTACGIAPDHAGDLWDRAFGDAVLNYSGALARRDEARGVHLATVHGLAREHDGPLLS